MRFSHGTQIQVHHITLLLTLCLEVLIKSVHLIIGTSKFYSPPNPSVKFTLNNLMLVPHITKNLVSVSKFAQDNGVYFEFHPTNSFVKSQASNQVLLEVHGINAVKLVPYNNKIAFEFCNTCCLGKSHKLYAPPSLTVYTSPSELLFSDLWGTGSIHLKMCCLMSPIIDPSETTQLAPTSSPSQPLLNTHFMLTWSKTCHAKPRALLAHVEPGTVKQALTHPQWLAAMKTEHAALLANETWSLVPLPPHYKAIGCKWVFRVKENPDTSINKYKACLVAKGFHQQPGLIEGYIACKLRLKEMSWKHASLPSGHNKGYTTENQVTPD
ncbi:putative mitochondrial protein, partial [Mucuna pruriens]